MSILTYKTLNEIAKEQVENVNFDEMDSIIFFDMDGVLAKFPQEHGEQGTKNYRTEQGFFATLEPYARLEEVADLMATHENIFILSSTPTHQARKDKHKWVNKHMLGVSKNRVLCITGNKADFVKDLIGRELDENIMLIDDYTKNLLAWKENGGLGVKRKNGINCKGGTWQGIIKARLDTVASYVDEFLIAE